jgi:phosphopantothenoylcysteine decarboxylase/phosphopantothenate--cysteine ligase
LKQDGVLFVGPEDGEMACGEFGPGRMAEPLDILASIESALEHATILPLPQAAARLEGPKPAQLLTGRHVLVTAGPTHEPIDPVRYIANRSSGRQGYAIAAAAVAAGAKVTLISGPVDLAEPAGLTLVKVETALEMDEAVESALPADIAIFSAAVADWRVSEAGRQKIKKKDAAPPHLSLVLNPDILARVSRHPTMRPGIVVGFAAETENLVENAQIKLENKGCDLILANDVSADTGIMGGKLNKVHVIGAQSIESWPELDKAHVAQRLIALLARRL